MTKLLMNDQLKGIEIYFDNKPSKDIRDNLKSKGFRYHGVKECWYAKQNIKTIAEAQKYTQDQTEAQEETIQQTENSITDITLTAAQTKTQKTITNMSLWDSTRWNEETNNINKSQTTKEIASDIRKHVRSRFPLCKFSITSSHSSISFHIVSSPYSKDSKHLEAIQNYCTKLLESYKYCTSYDPYGDYGSSYNFYGGHASIDYDYTQTEKTEETQKNIVDFDNKLKQAEQEEEEQKELDYQKAELEREQEHAQHLIRQTEEAKQVENIYNNITIADLPEDKQYFIINGQFANLNKNNTLDQYKEEIAKNDFYLNNVKIQKEIHFQTEEALQHFSNMLLNDFTFLENTGGSYTDDVRIKTMTDYENMTQEEQKTVIFNLYGVAIYYNNELQFVVDTQGYSYARYVGLVEGSTVTKHDNVKQFINPEQLEELKQKADTLEDYSVQVITENNLLNAWHSDKWNEYKELLKTTLSENNFKLTNGIIQQLLEDHEQLKICMYRLLKEVDGIQEQFKQADIKQGQKVTLFYISDFGGIAESRVTIDKVEYTKYAQYDRAVKLTFKPQGKRKLYYNYFYSTLLVYDGWLDLPKEVLNTIEHTKDFVITKTKYGSCDYKQYDEIIKHFEAQGQMPIVNTYKPII